MSDIAANLSDIRSQIASACAKAGRNTEDIELVAVSKTFPLGSVREAVEAGQLCFGESKLQEAEPKIAALPSSLDWHFIGGVQRNKVRRLLQNFGTIHAIDSWRLASHTDQISQELGIFPKIFLQVNVGKEETKGGFDTDVLVSEMESLLSLKRLDILGLMCIPPAGTDEESARPWFVRLREFRDKLERQFDVRLPSLSMGMSGDYRVAVEEGATHVRVGSAIFGKRAYRVDGELG